MNRYLVLLFLLIIIESQAQDFSLLEFRTFSDDQLGTLPYRILYPPDYDRSMEYPLVLFLHGAGERGNDNEKQLLHGVKHFLEDVTRDRFPCILVVPQCPDDGYWGSVIVDRSTQPRTFTFNYQNHITPALQLAIDLVKFLRKAEAVDKNRVYVTGLSMGGMGTLEAVYRQPKLFAAAVPVCGGADHSAYQKKHARIPFWFFHGDADTIVPVDFSRTAVMHLKSLGASIKYTEYPGVKHNSWVNAYAEPDLIPWMFKQHR
jgi:predicted peptidase